MSSSSLASVSAAGKYRVCLAAEGKRKNKGSCARGRCTARAKFAVWPSAYASGYAVQVCRGHQPDLEGIRRSELGARNSKTRNGPLARWYAEKWVDVCDPSAKRTCGGSRPNGYPYCRPSIRVDRHTPTTVNELSAAERKRRCGLKRRLEATASRTAKKPFKGRRPHRLSKVSMQKTTTKKRQRTGK